MTVARRGFLNRLPLALRFALRDLLGDPRGFGVFIACIVIGVAAISGVNGLSRALSQGLAKEGRTILGGDISFNLSHRELEPQERAWLEQRGRVDEIALMRAMAKREAATTPDGADPALVELKAVDPASTRSSARWRRSRGNPSRECWLCEATSSALSPIRC